MLLAIPALIQIRGDDICPHSKPSHLCQEGRSKDRIGTSIIPHYWIYQQKCIRAVEGVYEVENLPDLRFSGYKAGVYAVEMLPHLLPFGAVMLHLVCVVITVVAGIAGLCSQDCGWKRASLDAHGRMDGDGRSERAAAESGQIIDYSDLFRQVGSHPLMYYRLQLPFCRLYYH